MTPPARHAAAIQILDLIMSGQGVEKALKDWVRGHRFAGSGDRAAIRDICFEVLRKKRSVAALGSGETGRSLVLGLLRDQQRDPSDIFTGATYAPPVLTDDELATGDDVGILAEDVAADCPAWLWPIVNKSLGDECGVVFQILRNRAPLTMRANLRKSTRKQAMTALADHGINAVENPISPTAIDLPDYPRNLKNLPPYLEGLVELQDGASQAIVELLPDLVDADILDFCAGGGGKTLAIAGKLSGTFTAHDAFVQRMKDIPARAERAGIEVEILDALPDEERKFDLVFCDAPCSGSGSWRRDPAGKWNISPTSLTDVCDLQRKILVQAAEFVAADGYLAYATCSFLPDENTDQVKAFLEADPKWRLTTEKQFLPTPQGDGFYIAILKRLH